MFIPLSERGFTCLFVHRAIALRVTTGSLRNVYVSALLGFVMKAVCWLSQTFPWVQGGENEEDKDRQLPGSMPAELPNGRVPRLESSKGWGRLDLPSKAKPKPNKPVAVYPDTLTSHFIVHQHSEPSSVPASHCILGFNVSRDYSGLFPFTVGTWASVSVCVCAGTG